jgi:hypothetical protein
MAGLASRYVRAMAIPASGFPDAYRRAGQKPESGGFRRPVRARAREPWKNGDESLAERHGLSPI